MLPANSKNCMPKINKISIIIPVFNEAKTIRQVLESVEAVDVGLDKELVIVDDFSTDGSRDLLKELESKHKIHYHNKNMGKGAALRSGFALATGDAVIVQDADLEYSPADYPLLLSPIKNGVADVVYGSRFVGNQPHRVLYNAHFLANKFLTFLSNLFTGLNLSDMETGYKVFTAEAIKKILPDLKSDRFGIEPELTARVAKHKLRVYEVGISYNGRTYEEGKKITWHDGLAAIWHIIRFNMLTKK